MKVGEIFVLLGFNVDDQKLKQFDDGIRKLSVNLALMTASGVLAVKAIEAFTSESIERARSLDKFRKSTGESTDELQRWIAVNERYGISGEETQGVIEGLTKRLVALKMTGAGANPFANLEVWTGVKINPKGNKNPFVVLENLRIARDEFLKSGRGDEATFSKLIEDAGLGDNIIQALSISRDEFERKGNILLSPQEEEALVRTGQIIGEFTSKLTKLKSSFVADNEGGIVKFFDAVYYIVSEVSDALGVLMELWDKYPQTMNTVAGALTLILLPMRKLTLAIAAITWFLNSLDEMANDKRPFGLSHFHSDKDETLLDQITAREGEDPKKIPMDIKLADFASKLFGFFDKESQENWERRRANTVIQQRDGSFYRLTPANANINNTFNIHSNQDPSQVSNAVQDKLDGSISDTWQELNNGGY